MVATCLFGILLEILSGFVGTGGKLLISLSMRDKKPWRKRVTLWLGMLMNCLLGAVLDAAAYAFAAQSVIAPLNGVQISLNILLAPCILNEKVTRMHVMATLLVAGGASLTAFFGPHSSDPASIEELKDKLFSWVAICYVIFFSIVFLLCMAVIQSRPKGSGDRLRGIALGISAGGVAGNMCFMKCVVGILRENARGDWSSWADWLPYVLVVLAIVTAAGNVPLMVEGLKEYEAIFMVTLFGGSNIVMACVSGQLVLREMAEQSLQQQAAYWASALIIILGLIVINMTTVRGITEHKVIGGLMIETTSDDEASSLRAPHVLTPSDIIAKQRHMSVLWVTPTAGIASVTTIGPPKMRKQMSLPSRLGEVEGGNGTPRRRNSTTATCAVHGNTV
jgi:hypothetical protein